MGQTNGVEAMAQLSDVGQLGSDLSALVVRVSVLRFPHANSVSNSCIHYAWTLKMNTHKSGLLVGVKVFLNVNRVHKYIWVDALDEFSKLEHAWRGVRVAW